MPFGLLSTGFSAKPLADILTDIETSEKALIDATLDVSAESVIGQLNGIMAAHLAELWELAETVYNARSPGNASFQTLDDLAAITGASRAAAQKGTVTLSVTLAAGTTLPAGSVAAVAGSSTNRWVTTADVTNPGPGVASLPVAAQAQSPGYYPATTGTITEIVTPVSGWTAVTNALDAVPGTEAELDAALRVRREAMLGSGGTGPVDALRADILAIPGVRQCVVLENSTDVRDSNGLPPHSLEALVSYVGAGVPQLIGNAIWAGKPSGIEVFKRTTAWGGGYVPVAVTGADGVSRIMHFTAPSTLRVYVTAYVESTTAIYAGDTALKAAIAAVTDLQQMGAPLRISDLVLAGRAVAGVVDFSVEIGLSTTTKAAANLTCQPREVFDIATADVLVVTL